MGAAGGPNMVEDGLVLYYDTGNGKSYAGEPTENLATLDLSNTSVWYSESSDATKELQSETLFGYPVYRIQSKPGEIWRTPAAFNGYDKANGPITLSVYARNLGATATLSTYLSGDYSTDSLGNTNYKNIPTDGVWRKYSWTRTAADMNTTNQLEFRTSGDNMQISCPQVEHKLHPTPIVEGTRSSTEGLKDLTNNTTLDLSTAGFDSSADLLFDGSNDYVQGDISITTETITVEQVLKSPMSHRRCPFGLLTSLANTSYFALDWWIDPSSSDGEISVYTYNGSGYSNIVSTGYNIASLHANEYFHIVVVKNINELRVYINGQEIINSSTWPQGNPVTVNASYIRIGTRTVSGTIDQAWQGEIPVTKIYNRALTAEEVQNNFNGIRSRFGI